MMREMLQMTVKNLGHMPWLLAIVSISLRVVQVEAAADPSLGSNPRHQDNLTERQCRPVLNFGLPGGTNVDFSNSRMPLKLSQSIPDTFSFAIGDISLPLLPTTGGATDGSNSNGGTVQTAMKLLATLDAQIYGEPSEVDDSESVDDEDGDHSSETNVVRFKRNRLLLSGLNFTMLNVHLYQESEPRFAIGINIANTTLVGQFQYKGYIPAVSLLGSDQSRLAGHYRMSIDNLLLTGASNLTKIPTYSEQSKFRFKLASSELGMNISQLGYISIDILDASDSSRPTSNYVLKMVQRVLQKTIKRTYNTFEDYIRQTLEFEARQFLDCELTRFSPLLVDNVRNRQAPNSVRGLAPELQKVSITNATYLEDLAKIIRTEMMNSHLDRIKLPDFEYQRALFGSTAEINFHNGSLVGLDNVRLTGETRVKLMDENLIVNASVGWFELRPRYNWTMHFGSPGAANHNQQKSRTLESSERRAGTNQTVDQMKLDQQPEIKTSAKPMARGFVSFNISVIDFDAVISRSVRSHSHMVVEQLVIRRLDTPTMDIGGLPGMNRLARGAVNFFMGRLKQRLVTSIQPALKQELERTLNRMSILN